MAATIRSKPRGSQPITRHPLFPAIVALWFGVLFGMGAIAIRPSTLESLASALHLDRLIPAAAPPLGSTAQLAFALSFTVTGVVTGFVLARRLGRDPAPSVQRSSSIPAPEWPGVALADAGAEPFGPVAFVEPATSFGKARPEDTADESSDGPLAALDIASLDVTGSSAREASLENAPPAPLQTAAQRIASADIQTLSHVELIERLAIAIDRRRQRIAVEAESVVSFPTKAVRRTTGEAPDVQQTEAALREALDTLQRMSRG